MSASTNAVARLDMSIAASITTVARNLTERAALDPRGKLGAGMRPTARTRDLQQLMLSRQDRRLGQIDHLMTRRATHDPALPAEIVPALATLIGTNRERLIGIIDELARRALMPELRALLAL
jgi:hypothetical protein